MGGTSPGVITTALSAVVGATRDRVWQALTDPAEVIRWDEAMLSLLEPARDYPQVGQHVRWRTRLGTVPVVLHDRPLEVVPEQRLRSAVAMGLFRFDRTWSLHGDNGDGRRTRLGLRLAASNAIPVVGGLVDRFGVRQMAAEYVVTQLRALQGWCEHQPRDPLGCAAPR
jgi:uncharacterized protein YndB with AHSA1/START domain